MREFLVAVIVLMTAVPGHGSSGIEKNLPEIEVLQVDTLGDGCETSDTTDVNTSQNGGRNIVEIQYQDFNVQAGNENYTDSTYCYVRIFIKLPPGRYIEVNESMFEGYTYLPEGGRVEFAADVNFSTVGTPGSDDASVRSIFGREDSGKTFVVSTFKPVDSRTTNGCDTHATLFLKTTMSAWSNQDDGLVYGNMTEGELKTSFFYDLPFCQ